MDKATTCADRSSWSQRGRRRRRRNGDDGRPRVVMRAVVAEEEHARICSDAEERAKDGANKQFTQQYTAHLAATNLAGGQQAHQLSHRLPGAVATTTN